jgi:hypothetical protein
MQNMMDNMMGGLGWAMGLSASWFFLCSSSGSRPS